ncbi:hypothetical protein BOTBODRAFT_110708 [Botryobasidium botryosum FD-172 SS1]|uniref:Uncharacterized protein n=1 Tax=Botryobasidium botryosum (strain FD-172 SS1) TaxID=930990 RepID=A0A067MR48_BOTB1|nr:hypothetical protein BOTBODRAFT_110708 [Botryobasidium botryosum FD-172 SS1]
MNLSRSLSLRAGRLRAPPPKRLSPARARLASTSPPHPPPQSYLQVEENYTTPTSYTLSVFRRLFTYVSLGFGSVAAVTFIGFEGTHAWVERVELAREAAGEQYGWEYEREGWTGGVKGGTDPRLGWRARHAVRGAWVILNWGGSPEAGVLTDISTRVDGVPMDGGYAIAEEFLSYAIKVAQENPELSAEGLKGRCLRDLVVRRAGVWERVGSAESLVRAKDAWVEVWQAMEGEGREEERARIAVKIGNVAKRIGNGAEAVYWWDRAVGSLSGVVGDGAADAPSGEVLPRSPFAQRTLASAFLALSAHFAMTNQLRLAEAIEHSALRLFEPTAASLAAVGFRASAPQNLHTLFLQHRLALLKIHLAEVTYALNRPSPSQAKPKSSSSSSSSWFSRSTPEPEVEPEAPVTPSAALHTSFQTSRNLRAPASRLLRDAKRGTVEALVLEGYLHEERGNVKAAMERFAEAGAWVGKEAGKAGKQQSDEVVEEERKRVWAHWERAKAKLEVVPST